MALDEEREGQRLSPRTRGVDREGCRRGTAEMNYATGLAVSNQQKWDTVEAERSGVGWRSGELLEGPVVVSSPFDRKFQKMTDIRKNHSVEPGWRKGLV